MTELLSALRGAQIAHEGEIADRSDFQSHALGNAAFSEEHRRIIDSVGAGEIKEAVLVDRRGYHHVQHAPRQHAARRYEIRSLPLFTAKPPYIAWLLGVAAAMLGALLIRQVHVTGTARTALAEQRLMTTRNLESQKKKLETEIAERERQLGSQLDKVRDASEADKAKYLRHISDLNTTANGTIAGLHSELAMIRKENSRLKATISKLQAATPKPNDANLKDSDLPPSK